MFFAARLLRTSNMCSEGRRLMDTELCFAELPTRRGFGGSDFEQVALRKSLQPWGPSSSPLPRCTLMEAKFSGCQLAWGPAPRKEIL